MQLLRGLVPALAKQRAQRRQRIADAGLYHRLVVCVGTTQYVAEHAVAMAGMADTNTQPQIVRPQMLMQAAQAVVTSVTTAALEPYGTGRQVEIIVGDENFRWRQFVERSQRLYRLTAEIHVGGRLEQQQVAVGVAAASEFAAKARFHPE